jgi:hypothetical protein
MLSHHRFPIFSGPLAVTACLLAAGACAYPNAAFAQDVRARQSGSIVEMRGVCDASAVAALPRGGFDVFLVANDENEQLEAHKPDGTKLNVGNGDLRSLLRFDDSARAKVMKGEADLEGAAWLGDRIYLITSHGRNSDGERRPRREQIISLTAKSDASGVTVEVPSDMRSYRGLLDDLAKFPALSASIDTTDGKAPALAPEGGGLNIEGLAAGSDGTSLLIGLRNPLTQDGRAIVVPLMNASALLSNSQGKRAELGDPILLDLGNKGIRSIEYVENKQSYLILAGPRDDGTDFTLYLWSGRPNDGKPSEVKGVAEILKQIPETFRPEAMTINKESNRVLLVSDDGGRKFSGEDCKKLDPGDQRFRAVEISIEWP